LRIGLLLLAALARPLDAQLPPDLLVTVGTVAPSPSGHPSAYVAWGTAVPDRFGGHPVAVYSKPGGPDSTAPFVRHEVVSPALSGTLVAPRLAAGAALAVEVPPLDATLAALARQAGLPADPEPAVTLARLIQSRATHSSLVTELDLLATAHPGVALALGRAWTGPLAPGRNTVELREWDAATQRDRRVIGRVLLDTAGAPALPPPGPPVQVPDLTPAGHLLVRLRWATDPELRQRGPLQTGFNVWRVPRSIADQHGWLAQPPTVASLIAVATRVNDLPVVTARSFSPAEVADFAADPATHFLADDNRRFEPGGAPFPEGAEFAYFVTARDLLGRNGGVSPAGLAFVCDTQPPPVPLRLEVANSLERTGPATLAPTLVVSWDAAPDLPAGVTHYELFRSLDAADWRPLDPLPSTFRAQLPATPDPRVVWPDPSLFDDPTALGQTFWYAVRAVRQSRCGLIRSPLSPPIRGVLRDFNAPAAPAGTLVENCTRASIIYDHSGQAPLPDGAPGEWFDADGTRLRRHRVEVERRGPGIAWVEVIARDLLGEVHHSAPTWYAPDETVVGFDFARRLGAGAGPLLSLECRVGTEDGRRAVAFFDERLGEETVVTRFLAGTRSLEDLDPADPLSRPWLGSLTPETPPECLPLQLVGRPGPDGTLELLGALQPGVTYLIQERRPDGTRVVGAAAAEPLPPPAAGATVVLRDSLAGTGGSAGEAPFYCATPVREDRDETQTVRPCRHEAFPPDSDRIIGPRLRVDFDARTREYRLYRRVEDGPLTLIAQGALPYDDDDPGRRHILVRQDGALPDAGGTMCYFAQAVDAHGNGSSLAPLGCVTLDPRQLPVPVLARPQPAGDPAGPVLQLAWTCPPAGVGRFEVFVQAQGSTNLPSPLLAAAGSPVAFSLYQPAGNPPAAVHRTRDAFGQIVQVSLLRDRLVTDAVGSDGLGPGPQFHLTLPVEEGVRYLVFIKAVAPGPLFLARRSAPSFAYAFRWTQPVASDPGLVPWPQRPRPPVTAFHPEIVAVAHPPYARLWPTNVDEAPVGVRIGRLAPLARDVTDRAQPASDAGYVLATLPRGLPLEPVDPNPGLYRESVGAPPRPDLPVLPVVLYRQQVTNALLPNVSGDVIQVSPIVHRLTWEVRALDAELHAAVLVDPFVAVTRHWVNGDVTGGPPDVWLLDTHPVVSGARYRYWLVRFAPSGELDSLIPAGEVEVP
jgi:predicted nucleic acid-binding protein